MRHIKFDKDWPTERKFESVDDDNWRQQMDGGPLIYYKLTLWAFGLGELKSTYLCLKAGKQVN